MAIFGIDILTVGKRRVEALLKKARGGIDAIFKPPKSDPRSIPKQVLKMQQERFEKSGTNARAQKDPDRVGWNPGLNKSSRRTKNKDRSQLLVDTGKLQKAIHIARDSFRSMLVSDTGYAVIGVRHVQNRQDAARSDRTSQGGSTRGSVYVTKYTDEYGNLHQKGLGGMPKRTFLGIGTEDSREIEDSMKSTFDRFVGRFA